MNSLYSAHTHILLLTVSNAKKSCIQGKMEQKKVIKRNGKKERMRERKKIKMAQVYKALLFFYLKQEPADNKTQHESKSTGSDYKESAMSKIVAMDNDFCCHCNPYRWPHSLHDMAMRLFLQRIQNEHSVPTFYSVPLPRGFVCCLAIQC